MQYESRHHRLVLAVHSARTWGRTAILVVTGRRGAVANVAEGEGVAVQVRVAGRARRSRRHSPRLTDLQWDL